MKKSMKKETTTDISSLFETPGSYTTHLKVVAYGASGTGKTTFAASFPKPLLHIDINENTDRVIAGIDDVKTIRVDNTELMDELFWYLRDNPHEFNTIVIDTVSQLQELVLTEYMADMKAPNMGRPQMSQRAWGIVSSEMKVLISKWSLLGKDIVFIAQNRSFSTSDDNPQDQGIDPEVGPSVMPSVAKHLNASVDVLGNTFISEEIVKEKVKSKGKMKIGTKSIKNYSMRLGAHSVYTVKVRNRKDIVIPEYITDPTYDKLIDVIGGTYR